MWKVRGLGPVDLAVDTSKEKFGQAGGVEITTIEWFSIDNILEGPSQKRSKNCPLKRSLTRIECFSLRSLSSFSRKVLA